MFFDVSACFLSLAIIGLPWKYSTMSRVCVSGDIASVVDGIWVAQLDFVPKARIWDLGLDVWI